MKRNILFLLWVASLSPMAVNATLLGRVNSYYGDSAKVSEAKKTYEEKFSAYKAANESGDSVKVNVARENVKNAELDLALAKSEVQLSHPTMDASGVKTGMGPVSVASTSGGGTQLDFTAYRFNLVMPWSVKVKDVKEEDRVKKRKIPLYSFQGEENPNCLDRDINCHRFVPVYLLLHKSLNTQIDTNTLVHDLLDNEHGGLINFKLTPSIYSSISDSDKTPGGVSVMFDMGVKYVEAPTADPKNLNYVGAGYGGLGINLEMPMYYVDQQKTAGAKPAGMVAIGVGVYRNTVGSGGIPINLFATPVPRYFNSYVLGYEIQITNLFSVLGTRVIPRGGSPLGSYTSVAVQYQF